jgi:hypothetical protein
MYLAAMRDTEECQFHVKLERHGDTVWRYGDMEKRKKKGYVDK